MRVDVVYRVMAGPGLKAFNLFKYPFSDQRGQTLLRF